jgi:hypothetical protein
MSGAAEFFTAGFSFDFISDFGAVYLASGGAQRCGAFGALTFSVMVALISLTNSAFINGVKVLLKLIL